MTENPLVSAISAALAPLADAGRAAAMKAYMREQFDFLGIPTPVRRAAVSALLKPPLGGEALKQAAAALWALPQREFQYVAIDLLARQWKVLGIGDIAALLGLAQQHSWWDTVDGLAGVVGDIVRAGRVAGQPVMDAALRHENLWVRRIAMLHQLGWRNETDAGRLFAYALHLAPEPDFFIRKAIGWALRDYARHAPDAVRDFLARSDGQLSPLSVREAAKHL